MKSAEPAAATIPKAGGFSKKEWLAAVLDDNPEEGRQLCGLLEQNGFETAAFTDLDLLLGQIHQFDLLLCDIRLSGDALSFSRLNTQSNLPYIIYASHYPQHVFELFNANVLGFVSKRTPKKYLKTCLQKFFRLQQQNKKVEFHTWYETTTFLTAPIERIERIQKQIVLFYDSADQQSFVLTEKSIQDIEEMLDSEHFFRISRNCVINLEKIASADFAGRRLIMNSGAVCSVSRRKQAALAEAWKKVLLWKI